MTQLKPSGSTEKHALGKRIKSLRENGTWTLGELSDATKRIDPEGEGVSKVSISRYENGDSFPGFRELKLLSQALGASITFLFYGETPDPYAGWNMSLDGFLRDLIRDVLIDEGLLAGESRADRERKQRIALRAINSVLSQTDYEDTEPDDFSELEQLKKESFQRLEQQASTGGKTRNTTKTRKISKKF